jgi:cytochrome c oxidase cbb3-type subunit 3
MRYGCCILVFCLIAGCEREERPLHVETPATDVARAVEVSDVVPGPRPTSQPTTREVINQSHEPLRNDYEKNAYLLSEGGELYKVYNCKTCHAHGGGDIGPALIDDKWIYGSAPEQVYASIVQGRPNGMPAFGRRMTEHQAWELVAYVRSLSGQVPMAAAPGRSDSTKTQPPPNTIDPVKPVNSNTNGTENP